MSSVYFDPTVGGDGSTVTDDTNPSTGLANGGHRTRFVPALAQLVAVCANAVASAISALASKNSATASAATATAQATLASGYANAAIVASLSVATNFPASRPTLLLDFANSRRVDPRITFTRSSIATRVNEKGVIETVDANVPRIDFDPITLACKGLLIEESRVNVIANNTMVGAVSGTPGTLPTGWAFSQYGVSNLTSQVVLSGSESGISYLDFKISGTPNAGGTCVIFFNFSKSAALTAQAWSFSSYLSVVAGSTSNISLIRAGLSEFTSADALITNSYSNLSMPAAGALINARAAVKITTSGGATTAKVGNQHIEISVTSGQAVNITIRIGMPQSELGAFASSVIPTAGSAVTRSAETAVMTGGNFSSWFNASAGSVLSVSSVSAFSQNSVSEHRNTVISDGTNNNFFINRAVSNGSGAVFFDSYCGASTATQFDFGGTAKAAGDVVLQSLTYAANDCALSTNGAAVETDTSVTLPVVNQMSIGSTNIHIKRIAYWDKRLSNAELQALSTPA